MRACVKRGWWEDEVCSVTLLLLLLIGCSTCWRLVMCRAVDLLENAEWQFLQSEAAHQAAHCAYLRALLRDALGGQAGQRDSDAAAWAAAAAAAAALLGRGG